MHRDRQSFIVRLGVAGMIGLVASLLCYRYQVQFQRGAGDLGWAMRLLVDLFAGIDPYSYPISLTPSAYPLTTGIVAYPFTFFAPEVAAGLFFGLSSALLAAGLTRDQQWWRLLCFLALPYWQALITVQWSPLLCAVALYPALLPLTLAKPHIGLPIVLTNLTRWRLAGMAAFGVFSLALLPDWPLRWINHQGAPGQYLPPIVLLPFGPLLALALLRWRYDRARFLFFLSCVPQRLWYDLFLIFLVPSTPRAMLVLLASSWLAWLGWYFMPSVGTTWAVTLIYLPALAIVFWSTRQAPAEVRV